MKLYSTKEYRVTQDWPYVIGAGCLVYRMNEGVAEVLLLVRDSKSSSWQENQGLDITYHIPKGHAHMDETLQQSALRETEEEAGVVSEIVTYLGSKTDHFIHPKTQIKNVKTVHYFAAEWKSDLETADHEHSSKQWCSLVEAVTLLGKPNPKGEDEIATRLQKFFELVNE